jgi:hypothetical protein
MSLYLRDGVVTNLGLNKRNSDRPRNIEKVETEWNRAASSSQDSSNIKRWLRLAKELFDKDDDSRSNVS